ncbi:MAG: energy transducer TonB [Acidobacteriia bacterium]|nr:energy transducer TonB [Terriglobia bacterium]
MHVLVRAASLFAFTFPLLIMLALASGNDQTASPNQLIQAANDASDLSSLQPYRLEGSIVVNPGKANEKTGRLMILQDRNRSRSEIIFGKFREVKIVVDNKLYLDSDRAARPVELWGLPDLERLWRLTLASSDQVSAPSAMEVQEKQAYCFDVTIRKQVIERECFDPSSHVWIESANRQGGEKNGAPFHGTRFLDYASQGGKQFPRTIREISAGKITSEIRNIEIKPAQFQDSDFSIPPNTTPFETCQEMTPARVIEHSNPVYPEIARVAHVSGDVVIRAVIGKSGEIKTLRVISGHPILIQAAMDAVKRWRYTPAMCPSGTVAVQRDLTIRFHM